MEFMIDEALRYLGVSRPVPDTLRREVEQTAARLTAALRPRYVYRVFPLVQVEGGFQCSGTNVVLRGRSARLMLSECGQAALLACTLGAGFDAMLRTEQVRDMSRAVILDACGSAWVESGCDRAMEELMARLPWKYLTDRFSPGYGDLPLGLQPAICAALDTARRIGLYVTEDLLMNPVKSVTAIAGIADRPQMARVRGCAYCSLRETCALRRGGKNCAI